MDATHTDAIAIDFETANERRDSACAVGLAWIADGRVARRETRLIRPPTLRFSPGNIRIHGILPADVRDAPTCPDVLAEFLPDLSRTLVLAHNARFDIGVLAASLAAWDRTVPALSYLCTVQVARRVFPDPAGCSLAKVAARLGIRFAHHDAGEDAFACAEIALAAMRETGAGRVADLPGRLGLDVGRLTGAPAAGLGTTDAGTTVSARVLRSVRDGGPQDARLRFDILGSTGNRYGIVVEESRFGLYLRCDCRAGQHRRRCRHVEAVLAGDVTDLASGNARDIERLRARIAASAAVGPERRRDAEAVPGSGAYRRPGVG